MIKSLSIANYALIQELEMAPSANLNIITGETGAGKSIMLGALGLIMGNRADSKVLWDDQKKCKVEAIFDISDYNLEQLFVSLDLDFDAETIVRREVSPTGKSRAFVNDSPVTLDALKQLTQRLMDIHSQHESLQLNNNFYQLQVVDQFASHSSILESYQTAFSTYQEKKKQYETLLTKSRESAKEEDYQRFTLKELQGIELEDVNINKLEEELSLLENAEEIKQKLTQADQLLENDEISLLLQLQDITILIRDLNKLSGSFRDLDQRIGSVLIEIKDIQQELTLQNDRVSFDPEKLEKTQNQLSHIYRLQQKHGIATIEELIGLRDQLAKDLSSIDNLDDVLAKARLEMDKSLDQVLKIGKTLSLSRIKAGKIFQKEITKIIQQIGIENGNVTIHCDPTDPGPTGMDKCNIQFSANKGIEPRPLKEVASGGEFSRLIFAIKYLIADKTALPTIIFDEIDTGVSGEIALKMIRMMRSMGQNHQVISISHLPQFAAGGDTHYFVYKDHSQAKSITKIKELLPHEREEAIAKMIGGDNPSQMAFESARELLAIPS
jgi:DNA repair protein RecN (Recombination protein N)